MVSPSPSHHPSPDPVLQYPREKAYIHSWSTWMSQRPLTVMTSNLWHLSCPHDSTHHHHHHPKTRHASSPSLNLLKSPHMSLWIPSKQLLLRVYEYTSLHPHHSLAHHSIANKVMNISQTVQRWIASILPQKFQTIWIMCVCYHSRSTGHVTLVTAWPSRFNLIG